MDLGFAKKEKKLQIYRKWYKAHNICHRTAQHTHTHIHYLWNENMNFPSFNSRLTSIQWIYNLFFSFFERKERKNSVKKFFNTFSHLQLLYT